MRAPQPNALTFDVEAWFHAANLAVPRSRWDELPARLDGPIEDILLLLQRYETRATFFVLGWVARRMPHLVRRIHQAGHEIASHGYWHEPVTSQTPMSFVKDVRASKAILEGLIDEPVIGYRAPCYSINRSTSWALDELKALGFAYDSSVYPVRAPHGRYGDPAAPLHPYLARDGLWEFPLPVLRLFGCRWPVATGGYLRAWPMAATRRAFACARSSRPPVVVNIHPWEMDPHQPCWPASWANRFLHRINLRSTRRKLEQLLQSYHFVRLCDWWRRRDSNGAVLKQKALPSAIAAGMPDTMRGRPPFQDQATSETGRP